MPKTHCSPVFFEGRAGVEVDVALLSMPVADWLTGHIKMASDSSKL